MSGTFKRVTRFSRAIWTELRQRWASPPADVRVGYTTIAGFVLWLALCVVVGPPAFFMAPWCLVYPAVAVIALVLAIGLAFARGRRQRIAPFLLLSGCLATPLTAPWETVCVDLHLICRIYCAGGPASINSWAQQMIQEQEGKADGTVFIERDRIPRGVRRHLSGHMSVGGTIWSDVVRVRAELGGGFYHYGMVVYPSDHAPEQEWWQRILGWPPEVSIYHE